MRIEEALSHFPRENLTRTPTPLQRLVHLSRELGLNIYIKRDDLTDLALGGDKPRKLEYEIALAKANGADTLVTCGSSQSNFARLTAAAAIRSGMKCALVLSRDRWTAVQGNLLTVMLMGARVELVDSADHWDLESQAKSLCEEIAATGGRPHYIPVSGTTPISCLGYVRAGLETAVQLDELKLTLDAVYTPFGTGGIFSAMLLALRESGIRSSLIGISVNRRQKQCAANLDTWWQALCALLQCDPKLNREPYDLYDNYIGREYGDPTDACLEAVTLMARTEGILLDPVYSGKVFAALLDHIRAGRWAAQQSVLLLHSGGVPALFAYHEEIEAYLRNHRLLSPGI